MRDKALSQIFRVGKWRTGNSAIAAASFMVMAIGVPQLALADASDAQACAWVIGLSKTTNVVTQDDSLFNSNVQTFCSQYSSASDTNQSASFSAAYDYLSAAFGQSGASKSQVASKVCSGSDFKSARADAYREYVETIAPSAYASYNACIKLASSITFNVQPAALLAKEMTIGIAYRPAQAGSAVMTFTVSSDVTCTWNANGSAAGDKATLAPGTSAALKCSRPDSSVDSSVSVANLTSADVNAQLYLPWGARDKNGVPINLSRDLQQRFDAAMAALKESVVAFNSASCPAGWSEYAPAYGRFIRGIDHGTEKTDPDGLRVPGSIQADMLGSHSHNVKNMPQGSYSHGDSGSGDHLGAFAIRATDPAGGPETRPKNTALLYCIRN